MGLVAVSLPGTLECTRSSGLGAFKAPLCIRVRQAGHLHTKLPPPGAMHRPGLDEGVTFGSLYRPKYNILILISLLNLKWRNQFKKAPRQNNTICPGVCLYCFILPAISSRCHLDEGNTALL